MKNGMWGDLAVLLETRAAHLGSDGEAADLYHRAGELWLDRIGDPARGTSTFLRAMEVVPSHRGSAERLERIYREAGNYEALLQILTRWVEGLENYEPGKESASLRSALYQQIGEIWGGYYQRPDVAVTFYKRATQSDPTNVMAIYLAREIYVNAANYETAARLYDMEISAEPDRERRIALYRELAILHEQQLSDWDSALLTLKRAYELTPTNPDVLYELGTLLIRRIDAGQEATGDRRLASDAFYRLAQLSEDDIALQYLETALDLLPVHEACLDLYESSCARAARWEDMRLRLERCFDSIADSQERVPILRRLGRLHLERLGDAAKAADYYELLAEHGDPADLDVLRRLRGGEGMPASPAPAPASPPPAAQPSARTDAALAAEAGLAAEAAPAGLPDMGPGEKEAPPAAQPLAPVAEEPPPPEPEPALPPIDEEQVRKLRSDGEKLQKLGMVEKAEAKMLQVVEMAPEDAVAWAFLNKRFRSTNRFEELRNLLVSTSDSPRLGRDLKLQRLREAAAISETRLRDVEGSVGIYRRMVDLDPENEDARRSFERLLTSTKRWDDLVAYMEEDTYRITDPDKRFELIQKIADVHLLRREDPRSAYDVWWQAMEVRPDDLAVLAKLEELALRMREWPELDRVLRLKLDKTTEPEARLALFKRIVQLSSESLDDPASVLETCRSCLQEFPGDLDIIRMLAKREAEADDAESLMVTLQKLFDLSDEESEKSEALKQMAIIAWDRFDDAEMASDRWEKYLDRVPADLDACERYEKLLEGQGRHEDIIALYRKLIDDPALAEHQRAFLGRLGLLLSSEQVNRREEAMDVWRRLLEGGDDIHALRTLAAWDEEKERWPELRDNLERQARLAATPEERAAILRKLADVLYEKMHEPRAALSSLERILAELPKDRETLTAVRIINTDIEDFRRAAEVLELELAIPMEADEQLPLLSLLAGWYQDRLGDRKGAITAYERVLASAPGDLVAMNALDVLYDAEGENEKLLRLIRSKTKSEENEAERLGLLLRGAKVCEEKLGDKERAWSWYREIFSRISVDEDVLSVLEEAAHRLEQWRDLAAMYEDLAPRAADARTKVLRWRQAADLYAQRIGDHAQALYDIYQAVLADPDDVTLLDGADAAALECKDWERLGGIYERLSRGLDDVEARVMLMRRFGDVVWRRGGFAQGAVMPLLRATDELPNDEELFEEFYGAAIEAQEYRELLGAFEKRFRSTDDKEKRLEIKLRMARIMAEHMQSVDGAIKIIQEAVEVDPANERFGRLIFEAARGVENNLKDGNEGYVYSWLLRTYQAHAESYEASDPIRVVFLRQIARIFRDGLDDAPGAFNTFKEAHRLNPADLVLLESLEVLAGNESYWEALADHLTGILRLSLKPEHAELMHDRLARILAEELSRPEEAADHYWHLIQNNPDHPSAFRKLSEFYRSVGRFNDLLVILESAMEKTTDTEHRLELLRETARVWDRDLNNRFEALDAYKKILEMVPDDEEATASLDRLQKSKLGLASRLGGGDEEEDDDDEAVDVDELRRSLLEEDFETLKPRKPDKKPAAEKAPSDELPDWDDAVNTGEVPLQKVSQLLAMSREGDETDAGAPGDRAGDLSPSKEPSPVAGAEPASPMDAAAAGPDAEDVAMEPSAAEPQEAQDEGGLPAIGEDEVTPVEPPPAPADEPSYVLDDDNLSDMLEEEYAVDEFAGGQAHAATESSPPPLPPRRDDGRPAGDSLPPPPPPVRRKGQKLTPPPPPRKKKRS